MWLICDKRGIECTATCRMTKEWRAALEADGSTVYGPVIVKLTRPKPVQSVDLSQPELPAWNAVEGDQT